MTHLEHNQHTRLGLTELISKTGIGKPNMGTETQGACGNKTQGNKVWHYTALWKARPRAIHHPMGAQEAFRAAPIPGAMAGQGTREAMAEQGIQEAIVGPPSSPRPQPPPQPLWLELYYPPPQKKKNNSLGIVGALTGRHVGGVGSWGRSVSAGSWGRSGSANTWGRSGNAVTWGRSGSGTPGGALTVRALASSGMLWVDGRCLPWRKRCDVELRWLVPLRQ